MVTEDKSQDPQTPEEWKDAVNAAEYSLLIDSAIQYGLLERRDERGNKIPGSGVNVERCIQILEQGKKLGIFPDPNLVDKLKPNRPISEKEYTGKGYQQPGRRCKIPKNYFQTIKRQTHEKEKIK